jgi:hypothetical protein
MTNGGDERLKTRRRFANIWNELAYVCKHIHYWWYVRKDKTSAKRYLNRLQRVLDELPENDLAIIREEGLAWLHHLKGEKSLAIKHRKREIRLIERLHASVRRSLTNGDYDESVATFALAGRDLAGLEERRAILKALKEEKPRKE